jgi:hypothetical protein
MSRTKSKKQKAPEPGNCEVPRCKEMMGKSGVLYKGKRICAGHWAKDGKRGFSLRRIFGFKHETFMGGDILLDQNCRICKNNTEAATAREQKKNAKATMKHPVPLPKGHARTPIYKVIPQNNF